MEATSAVANWTAQNASADLKAAVREFFAKRGCLVAHGPERRDFETLGPGGAERRRFVHRVLCEGGIKAEGKVCGNGSNSYDELKIAFLMQLEIHTRRHLPILVRAEPECDMADGIWRAYFRFVQLDFDTHEILIVWPLAYGA